MQHLPISHELILLIASVALVH